MKLKRKLLLANTIFLSLYLIGGTAYYLLAGGDQYETHPVFASLYVGFVAIHAGIVGIALLFQWWGYLGKKGGPIVVSSLFLLLAGVELILLLVPMAAMIVAIVLNAIAGRPAPAQTKSA
jgi:hypothetical protein